MGIANCRRIAAGWLTAVLLGITSSAHALVVPSNASDRLSIGIAGHITPRCSVAAKGPAAVSFGPIMDGRTGAAIPASVDLPFSFECNAGYTASLVSRHGGLAFDGSPANGFSNLVGYSATIGLQKGQGNLSLRCESADMRNTTAGNFPTNSNCRGNSEGHDFSAGDGVVKVKLKGGGLPLLAGTYSDELVLQIAPNLGG
jgi:hypothetical protein